MRALAAQPYLEGELIYAEKIHELDTPTLSAVLMRLTELHRGTSPQPVPLKRPRDATSDEVNEDTAIKRYKSYEHAREAQTEQSMSAVAAMLGTYHARHREKLFAEQLQRSTLNRMPPVVDTTGTVPRVINAHLPRDPVSLTLELSALLKQHQIEVCHVLSELCLTI